MGLIPNDVYQPRLCTIEKLSKEDMYGFSIKSNHCSIVVYSDSPAERLVVFGPLSNLPVRIYGGQVDQLPNVWASLSSTTGALELMSIPGAAQSCPNADLVIHLDGETVDLTKPETVFRGGLLTGDRIFAVNGRSVIGEDHNCIVSLITSSPNLLELLVISEAGAKWYEENGIQVTMDLPNVQRALPKNHVPTSKPSTKLANASNEPLIYFEGRIRDLQLYKMCSSAKTFTRWCNVFLSRANLEFVNIFEEIGDGIRLIKLLEIISDAKLRRPHPSQLRIHKLQNVSIALEFLRRRGVAGDIGAEDIVDRNEKLILALIWAVIHHFQIDSPIIDREVAYRQRRNGKRELLKWCQTRTAGYPRVSVTNFTTSWRDGLTFNALIHCHRPDLMDYNGRSGSWMSEYEPSDRLNHAFAIAENELGIVRLLDAEDVDVESPEEAPIIIYVSMYYQYFVKQRN